MVLQGIVFKQITEMKELQYHTDIFQQHLNENCNQIKSENKMIIPADKTTNYYLVEKNDIQLGSDFSRQFGGIFCH